MQLPRHRLWKTYWVQVEGGFSSSAAAALERGVELRDGRTRPARCRAIAPPAVWARQPPIRHRLSVPDSWVEISICEGRNRQLRRMTAAEGFPTLRLVPNPNPNPNPNSNQVGFPTLRLIRVAVGGWSLGGLLPGESIEMARLGLGLGLLLWFGLALILTLP